MTGGDPPEIIYLICLAGSDVDRRGAHRQNGKEDNLEESRSRSSRRREVGWTGQGTDATRCKGRRDKRGTWEVLEQKYRLTCEYVFIRGR